jgi:hypothetical protein
VQCIPNFKHVCWHVSELEEKKNHSLPCSFHIDRYWDLTGDTIAFNRGKSLFFNAKYYMGLHYPKRDTRESKEAYFYWFMIFCHELAHNFVHAHNASHEFWMTSFAQEFMGVFIQKLKQIRIVS